MRALVIGTGYAGSRHADALRELGIDLVGPLSARDALRDPDAAVREGDVVHVCAANDLHYAFASAALRAGKHVICEKPLTLDLAQARELAELWQAHARRGRYGFVAYNYRFYPMVWELIARIASGELGELRHVRVSFLQEWLLTPPEQTWRYDAGAGSVSRIVADLGSHAIDLAEAVVDSNVASIVATVGEHEATVLAQLGSGRATFVLSQVAAGHQNDVEIEVDGTKGSAHWRFVERDALRIARPGAAFSVTRDGPFVSPFARELASRAPGPNEARRNLIDEAYRFIRGDRRRPWLPVPTFFDGMRHVRIAAAALESHRERRWVELLDPPARATAHLVRP